MNVGNAPVIQAINGKPLKYKQMEESQWNTGECEQSPRYTGDWKEVFVIQLNASKVNDTQANVTKAPEIQVNMYRKVKQLIYWYSKRNESFWLTGEWKESPWYTTEGKKAPNTQIKVRKAPGSTDGCKYSKASDRPVNDGKAPDSAKKPWNTSEFR